LDWRSPTTSQIWPNYSSLLASWSTYRTSRHAWRTQAASRWDNRCNSSPTGYLDTFASMLSSTTCGTCNVWWVCHTPLNAAMLLQP
jgi:hypothetical protein